MITKNASVCPKCGGHLRFFDTVKRIVRTKARVTEWIVIRRLRCTICGSLHRELPEELFPYKQYEAEVIIGVLEGLTIGTLVIVGAVSTAGAALWTNVLNDKLKLVQAKKAHSKSDKVIVVDFKKARRDMGR